MTVVRYLEERGGICLVSEVAEGVGAKTHVVRHLISTHLEILLAREHRAVFVPRGMDDADEVILVELEWSRDRLTGGLGQFGFFPYSKAEVDERVEVIDRAIEQHVLDEAREKALASARDKLTRWREHLDRESMS